MKFGHKIALAFLGLTGLTLVTGCIGLLFVSRVLSILGTASDQEGPIVRNLADLNRYMKKAVAISQDVSGDLEVAELVQLRREFNRVAHDFDQAFQQMRKEVEDEISLGRIEQMSAEQRALKEQTQTLISAIIDELQVERQVNDRLSASQAAWRNLVELLGAEVTTEPAARSGTPGVSPPSQEATLAAPGSGPPDFGQTSLQRLQVLPEVQHLLMLVRLELNEYFSLQDGGELEQADLRVRALFARATAAVGTLFTVSTDAQGSARNERIEAAFAGWRDAFVREDGALELYKRKVELAGRTDQLSRSIQAEARDTLRVLDSLVTIRNRLVAPDAARGFVTAAPSLLILTIVAATLVSALLAVILTMNITRPVRKLIVAAEAVGSGDYSHRLTVDSGDELAQLGVAFNRMTSEIACSHDRIRALNAGLEQRVAERTRALEDEVRERRRAELSLRESEDRYRTLIESFPSGIIALVDHTLRLIAVGGEAIRRAGAGPEDFVGRALEELCPPGLAGELLPRLEAAFEGVPQEFESSAAQSEWHVWIVSNPAAEDGPPETVTVLALDVTDAKRNAEQVKQKQQQLVQAEKLASLGVLAAGMAHEINNPNQAIMMGGQLAARAWPDIRRLVDRYFEREGDFLVGGTSYSVVRETLGEQLRGIVSSAKRIEAIVSSLKGFARQDHTDMNQPVNLNLVVRSALVLLSNVVKKATDHLTVSLSPDLPTIRGNAQQVEQVVVNLVHNACQALVDRAQPVTVATYPDRERDVVVLEVSDGGAGIPEESLQRIRDPFYTTKRDSGGTGLGLSVSATIVQEHGGSMHFASRPGAGTSVKVRFPAGGRAPGGLA